jgi:hypothetical protein
MPPVRPTYGTSARRGSLGRRIDRAIPQPIVAAQRNLIHSGGLPSPRAFPWSELGRPVASHSRLLNRADASCNRCFTRSESVYRNRRGIPLGFMIRTSSGNVVRSRL